MTGAGLANRSRVREQELKNRSRVGEQELKNRSRVREQELKNRSRVREQELKQSCYLLPKFGSSPEFGVFQEIAQKIL